MIFEKNPKESLYNVLAKEVIKSGSRTFESKQRVLNSHPLPYDKAMILINKYLYKMGTETICHLELVE